MNKILKATSVALSAITLLSTTALALDKTIPVRATFEEKGYQVAWVQESKTVVISDGGFVVKETVGEDITLDVDTTYTSEEFVAEVEGMRKAYEEYSTLASVADIGEGYFMANTEKLGEVMFTVDTNSIFRHERNRRRYMFSDLEVGSSVKVYFDQAMTASLPPQVYAIEVVFVEPEAIEETLTTAGKITEIGEDYFVMETENGEYQMNVSEETFVHHIKNRRLYRFADLENGMEVEVKHSVAATLSLPPQSTALEVIIK